MTLASTGLAATSQSILLSIDIKPRQKGLLLLPRMVQIQMFALTDRIRLAMLLIRQFRVLRLAASDCVVLC